MKDGAAIGIYPPEQLKIVGASEINWDVLTDHIFDVVPSPKELIARIYILYDMSFVRPEIVTGLIISGGINAVHKLSSLTLLIEPSI